MREGKPSFTAACVSAARGLRDVDPLAPSLVEGPLGLMLRIGRGAPRRIAVLNIAMLGLVDHIEMRTAAIDRAVRDAVAEGTRQIVVLGAGLDARAYRMPELRDARVFEVDHPSTQAYKRAHVGVRKPLARELSFVAVDFERDSLDESLAREGHDAAVPTLWLWEGVTPYLPVEATRATLAAVSARSNAGSRLVLTYVTPVASRLGAGFLLLAKLGFRVIGESIRGRYTPAEMKTELRSAGFRLEEDTSPEEWGVRSAPGRRLLLLVDERLAVATMQGRAAHR